MFCISYLELMFSLSYFVFLGMIEPEAVCARLEEFTEVAIAPNISNKQSTALCNKQTETADDLMGGNKQRYIVLKK